MDNATLQRAKKIDDERRELKRVLEHFSRPEVLSGEKSTDVLLNFLTKCGNLGSTTLKKELASLAVDAIRGKIEADIHRLHLEFEKL